LQIGLAVLGKLRKLRLTECRLSRHLNIQRRNRETGANRGVVGRCLVPNRRSIRARWVVNRLAIAVLCGSNRSVSQPQCRCLVYRLAIRGRYLRSCLRGRKRRQWQTRLECRVAQTADRGIRSDG
jgi:hypothetical protein